jgi:hypothetical protein
LRLPSGGLDIDQVKEADDASLETTQAFVPFAERVRVMRTMLLLGFTAGLVVAGFSPAAATIVHPIGPQKVQAVTSAFEGVTYTYRRTKHGFQRCFHRNRFSTRSWRSLIYRVPDC